MAGRQEPPPGRLVATARKMWDMTQQDLADRLTEITGVRWTQPQISDIERGRHPLTVEDLPAFAEAQRVKTTWYLGHGLDELLPPAASLGDSGASLDRGTAAFTSVTDIGQARKARQTVEADAA